MTITKEQIARLRELDCVDADFVIDQNSAIPALLDELERLRSENERLWSAHNDFINGTYYERTEEIHRLRRELEQRDCKEGARVFDAVMEEFAKLHPDYLDQGKYESVLGMRQRILGGEE